jgi:N,N'-diacetylchitobiose transport system substrate-binding protein
VKQGMLRAIGVRAIGVTAWAVTVAVAAAACGGSGDDDGSSGGKAGTTTLAVWLMRDTASDDFVKAYKSDFEAAHPGVRLDVQIQEWDGIGEKISSALASKDAPDVIEVGNTQVAQYAASGGVTDLSGRVTEWGGKDWLPGLAGPGKVDGKQYGIPFYAANRVVIYDKTKFSKAGITTPPKTRDEWLKDTGRLNTGKQQGIYLPGQNWFVLSGFIWDEGGDLAVQEGGKWKGALSTPQALAGMDFYKKLQALGKGPKDSDEAKPNQIDVFAKGDVAQFIATPGAAGLVTKASPKLKDRLGFFPIPGKTPDKPGTVFTGGSDLIIPLASKHQSQAVEVVKSLAGDRWQKELATTMSYVPNKLALTSAVSAQPGTTAMAAAAANGRATPNSPNWAAVEAKNPLKEFQTKVLTGGDPAAAAREADNVITKALNS